MSVFENRSWSLLLDKSKKNKGKVAIENRRSVRFSCSIPVLVKLPNGRTFTAWTQNISAEGLFVEYPIADEGDALKTNDKLELVLNSPFLPGQSVNERLCRVVAALRKSDSRGLLRLEAAEDASGEIGSGHGAIIQPADYIALAALETEFLKTLELIDFMLPGQQAKLVVVTSAHENAGASTFSCWFASCLARMINRKVLYVDGNLRQCGSGKALLDHVGLLNILHGQCQSDDAVVDHGPGCPQILNSGNAGNYQSGEVSEKMVNDTFTVLRDKYDYIVVDALPVNTSPFTLMLAREADGVLLVIESKKTERGAARDALNLLYQFGSNVLGAVLNRV